MIFLKNHPTEILILIFLIITFLLSSIEKITNWKGSVSYIENHFEYSPLKRFVPQLLLVLLIIEIIATLFMIVGLYLLISNGSKYFALIGAVTSSFSLIFMLIGQRLAKDYEGSMNISIYFIINIIAVYLLQ